MIKSLPYESKVDRNTEAGKKRYEQGKLLRSLWNDQNCPLFTKTEIAEKQLSPADTAKLAAMKKKWEDLQAAVPPRYDVIRVLSGNGRGMNVLIRGNPASQGPAAQLRFLQVLSSQEPPEKFTRLELADAIASSENPLTARVIVNRVWAWHFGRGLVATPSNFGVTGDRPSHPELLDWLAVRFVEEGWSLKWLHREIMRSQTWQQTSIDVAANAAKDADNTYLWRFNRRRLEIEPWRDSLLAVAGRLDLKFGGPSLDLRDANNVRRTVYGKVSRKELDPLLAMFDFPDANVTAEKRNVTTVPQQQLVVLNSEFFVTQVQAFAARAAAVAKTDSDRVVAAYRLAFGRLPTSDEATLAAEFLALPPVPEYKLSRWEQYCQLLLASNEFCLVD